MTVIETGRNGAMLKEYKNADIKDLLREYFNHPIWRTN